MKDLWPEQWIWLTIFLAVFMTLNYFFCPKIKTQDAVDAIVGEAADQDFETMVCIAQAIRNRGTLKGVYGFHAKHNKAENSETWEAARDAWALSGFVPDKIHRAKNFGTFEDLDKLVIDHEQIKKVSGRFYFY